MQSRRVSHYTLAEKLGEGTYGVVWRGVHAHDSELQVAVKLVRPALLREDGFLDSLKMECRQLDRLDHPNIVRFRELAIGTDHVALILELLTGQDLHQHIAGRPQPIPLVVHVLHESLDGLAHAHQRGVIHRDIKPSNLFLCGNGRAKLLDFGLARVADGSQAAQSGQLKGTLDYMAPERFTSGGGDAAADVYALGLVAWELLTGRPACQGSDLAQKLGWHLGVGAPHPQVHRPDCPAWLADLVACLCARDVSSRPRDGTAALAMLEAARPSDVASYASTPQHVRRSQVHHSVDTVPPPTVELSQGGYTPIEDPSATSEGVASVPPPTVQLRRPNPPIKEDPPQQPPPRPDAKTRTGTDPLVPTRPDSPAAVKAPASSATARPRAPRWTVLGLTAGAAIVLAVGWAALWSDGGSPEVSEGTPHTAPTPAPSVTRSDRGAATKSSTGDDDRSEDAVPADVASPPRTATRTASGLAYKVVERGTGRTHPTAESTVTVHYTGWTTDGKMFDSSRTRGKPTSFPLDRVIEGWTEGLQLMVEGEKARLWIPEALAYQGKPGRPAGMLVFDVELLDIETPRTVETPTHLTAPPSSATRTASGLAYQVLRAGSGTTRPSESAKVTVHYSGWTTDGNMFDSSVERGKPATFPLKGVINGWIEGVQLMRTGEKTRFWIPADLAYGHSPRAGTPKGMLIFDIELLEFE